MQDQQQFKEGNIINTMSTHKYTKTLTYQQANASSKSLPKSREITTPKLSKYKNCG